MENSNVLLIMETMTFDGENFDRFTYRYDAVYRRKDGVDYLMFDDRVLRFDGKVLRETDKLGGRKIFEAGETYPAIISSSAGNISLKFQTVELSGTLHTDLELVYNTLFNGQPLIKHQVNMRIEEKKNDHQ